MWTRNPFPSIFNFINVTGTAIIQSLGIQQNGSITFAIPSGSTRTTPGLQVQPRFGNSWVTDATGTLQLTAARFPDGMVHLNGIVTNSTAALRADGTYAFDFTATAFAQTFIPKVEVHMLADGADRANNQQPVFVIGTDGTVRCYNLDIATAGAISYRISHCYNITTEPGKYEGTGGF